MATPSLNDNEEQKFWLSDTGEVFVNMEIKTIDPLADPLHNSKNDLEQKKFTTDKKVRIVLSS